MKRVGIKDVAREVGVSITTVSRALNGYTDVSEETKRKIKEVAKRLNYVPDINARTLGGKAQISVALLVSGLRHTDESGFVFGVLSGAYHSTIEKNYDFILLTTNQGRQKEMSYLQLCREKKINGVVIQGIRTDDPYYEELIKSEIPCVVIDLDLKGENVSSVSIDNVDAAYTAVKNIIEKGHKNIGMINGIDTAEVSRDRFTGYAKALIEKSISIKLEYVKNGRYDENIAYREAIGLISENPEVTAIFCSSDVMAIGVIRAINDMGKKVPDDISVVGFDDIPISKYINGGLSTVKQDPFITGQIAINMLCDMINNKEIESHVYLPYEFIDRNTIKKIQ